MIGEIPEYLTLLNQINEHKKLLNQQRRAIKSLKKKIERVEKKYQFLFDIFSPHIDDIILESKVYLLFKELGFNNIIHITGDNRNPDIVIDYNGFKTVVEVKNTKNQIIKEKEIFQVVKYKQRYQDDYKGSVIRGILVLNHDNQLKIKDRSKNPFDSYYKRDAELNQYSLVTTVELLKAFLLIKKEVLSFEDFDRIVHTPGVVKFSKGK